VWDGALSAAGLRPPAPLLDRLASGFRLDRDQIRDAVAAARHAMRFHGRVDPADLFAAARARGGHAMAQLARKVDPIYRWPDLVLPPDTIAQLQELCCRATFRHQVLEHWGFGRKLSGGKGITALFTGASGTGKTMAAEVVANELELELYKINLATVVSKYIGETEKNLERIFAAAEGTHAILFFDEADALFGKRSEVRDSHDRYANLEISYLLQKMEEYEGVAILASNLRQNLDEAFLRRLSFSVSFPFPDESSRRRIWSGIWPARLPLDESADLDYMARAFKLSGGAIRNVALAAAFTAASGGGRVTMGHLLAAIRREYQKLGKRVSQEDLDRDFSTLPHLEATA
jgi:SpoVK/Ycf46/Vps4 family AAA+-type ATPase